MNYTDPGNVISPGNFFGSASSAAKASMGLIGVKAMAIRNAGGAQAEFVHSFTAPTMTPGATTVQINLAPALSGMQNGGLGPTETTDLAHTLSYKNAAGYTAGSSTGYYTRYANGANGQVTMSAQINGGQSMAVNAIPGISLIVPVGDTVVIYGELDTSVSGTSTSTALADFIDTAV